MMQDTRTRLDIRNTGSCPGSEWPALSIVNRPGIRGGAVAHPTIPRTGERSTVVLPLGH